MSVLHHALQSRGIRTSGRGGGSSSDSGLMGAKNVINDGVGKNVAVGHVIHIDNPGGCTP